MRELNPQAAWSHEAHLLANLLDLVGDLFAQDYDHIQRPGASKPFASAELVDEDGYAQLLEMFGGGVSNG